MRFVIWSDVQDCSTEHKALQMRVWRNLKSFRQITRFTQVRSCTNFQKILMYVGIWKISILLLMQKTTVCLGVFTISKTYIHYYFYTYFELNHKTPSVAGGGIPNCRSRL